MVRRPRLAGVLLSVLAKHGTAAARQWCEDEGVPIRDGEPTFYRGRGGEDDG